MLETVLRRLGQLVELSPRDCDLLRTCMGRLRRLPAHADIIQEGNDPRFLNVVLEGWACRYKQLEDGRRQILAVFLPGDMCDPCVFLLDQMSHALATLTPAVIARVAERDVMDVMSASKAIEQAFWLEMMIGADMQREWTVSLGRRTATERMAHFCCELMIRLRASGTAEGRSCEMPITQADLGDALGLSTVHVNRTLQELRALQLIELRQRRLTIHNEPALQAVAQFNPNYLHLHRRSAG